mgnify:CR=1 FL=1
MARRGMVVIDRERCKSCYLCIRACPKQVLQADTQTNASGGYPAFAKHPDACIGCGNCFLVCPDVAFEVFVREDGE